MICKVERKSNGFGIVSSDVMLDTCLSSDARFLLAMVSVLPKNWQFYMSWLRVKTGWGKEKLQKVLKELEGKQHLKRVRFMPSADNERDRISWEYTFILETENNKGGYTTRGDAVSQIGYGQAKLSRDQVAELRDMQSKCKPEKAKLANQMRRNLTPAEECFWLACKSQKLQGIAPQIPVYGYIADFLIADHKIIVEIDGSFHNGREDYDSQRDEHLRRVGYRVIRFTNEEVLADVSAVLNRLRSEMA